MRACEPKVFINHSWRTVARLCFDKIHIGILLAAVEFEPHDIDTSHSAKAVGQLQLMTRVETCEASAAI